MAENLYQTLGKYEPDNLIAGHNVPILTSAVTLASGQGILKRGTVLGIITSTGKAVKVDKSKSDGSQIANSILTDDTDAEKDINATVYTSGLFNKNALIFSENNTVGDHETKLRELGIFLKNVL